MPVSSLSIEITFVSFGCPKIMTKTKPVTDLNIRVKKITLCRQITFQVAPSFNKLRFKETLLNNLAFV